jgi:hypothetical protein
VKPTEAELDVAFAIMTNDPRAGDIANALCDQRAEFAAKLRKLAKTIAASTPGGARIASHARSGR